jgi:hypothetical protein
MPDLIIDVAGGAKTAWDNPAQLLGFNPMPPAEAPAPSLPAAQPLAAGEDVRSKLDTAIGAWVAGYVHNSPIARDTAGFNHLMQVALPALRLALEETI